MLSISIITPVLQFHLELCIVEVADINGFPSEIGWSAANFVHREEAQTAKSQRLDHTT
jgi:hypothetical protein